MNSLLPDEGVDIGWWHLKAQPSLKSSFALADVDAFPLHHCDTLLFSPTPVPPASLCQHDVDEPPRWGPHLLHNYPSTQALTHHNQDDSESILSRDEDAHTHAPALQPPEFGDEALCSWYFADRVPVPSLIPGRSFDWVSRKQAHRILVRR